jgi:hypothetical protein
MDVQTFKIFEIWDFGKPYKHYKYCILMTIFFTYTDTLPNSIEYNMHMSIVHTQITQ